MSARPPDLSSPRRRRRDRHERLCLWLWRPGKERLILVDLGVTFPDMDGAPGVDLILPDIAWLEERADRLEAIFITHAHEDHVGALGLLWPRLKKPRSMPAASPPPSAG
jgi:mRNA degradation ribonuclease J1/J2